MIFYAKEFMMKEGLILRRYNEQRTEKCCKSEKKTE